MNNFRITGPGLFVNRKGEKVEIINGPYSGDFPWVDTDGASYRTDGSYRSHGASNYDIVGVWGEPILQTADRVINAKYQVGYIGDKAPLEFNTLNEAVFAFRELLWDNNFIVSENFSIIRNELTLKGSELQSEEEVGV